VLLPIEGHAVKAAPAIWPPVGSIETFGTVVAVILFVAAAAFPSMLRTKAIARKAAVASFILVAALFFFYAHLLQTYVRRVETVNDEVFYRTIGSERTEYAIKKLPGASDEELLESTTLDDQGIKRMWTPSSVDHADYSVFIAYLVTFSAANFLVGALARLGIEVKTE
jgi:hypothetical protein